MGTRDSRTTHPKLHNRRVRALVVVRRRILGLESGTNGFIEKHGQGALLLDETRTKLLQKALVEETNLLRKIGHLQD